MLKDIQKEILIIKKGEPHYDYALECFKRTEKRKNILSKLTHGKPNLSRFDDYKLVLLDSGVHEKYGGTVYHIIKDELNATETNRICKFNDTCLGNLILKRNDEQLDYRISLNEIPTDILKKLPVKFDVIYDAEGDFNRGWTCHFYLFYVTYNGFNYPVGYHKVSYVPKERFKKYNYKTDADLKDAGISGNIKSFKKYQVDKPKTDFIRIFDVYQNNGLGLKILEATIEDIVNNLKLPFYFSMLTQPASQAIFDKVKNKPKYNIKYNIHNSYEGKYRRYYVKSINNVK